MDLNSHYEILENKEVNETNETNQNILDMSIIEIKEDNKETFIATENKNKKIIKKEKTFCEKYRDHIIIVFFVIFIIILVLLLIFH